MTQSNISANYSGGSFILAFSPYGNVPISGGRYYSDSNCGGGSKVLFGNSLETINDSAVEIGMSFTINANSLDFNQYTVTTFPDMGSICGGETVNMQCDLTQSSGIIGYCGEDRCLLIKPWDSDDVWVFYLKGGTEENGKVSLEDYGMLFFCGLNTSPGAFGTPMLTVRVTGNVISVSATPIEDFETKVNTGEGHLTLYTTMCSGFPDDDDEDEDKDSDCDNCSIDVSVACNSAQFTSDINEFPDLTVPDTYINPDTGEEERLSWNGLMHVAKVLNCAFKAFYAYQSKQNCILNKRLKEISESLKEISIKEVVNEITVESNHSAYVGKAAYTFTDLD